MFLEVLEQTRKKYEFVVAGYVVMPEHIHLLIGEPKIADPSRVMQVLKQRVSLQCLSRKRPAQQDLLTFGGQLPPSFWLPRSHDFNVGTKKKYVEKLNYIHFNPVKRGLVTSPELWAWSSFGITGMAKKDPSKLESNCLPPLATEHTSAQTTRGRESQRMGHPTLF